MSAKQEKCFVCGKFMANGYECDICGNDSCLSCGTYTSNANESNSSPDGDTFYCKKCIGEKEVYIVEFENGGTHHFWLVS